VRGAGAIDLGIAGRVAVVTGGSRGVGRGCAIALAREGAKVCICARRLDRLEETAEEIRRATGAEVLVVQADMEQPEDIKRMVATVAERFGRIDILVNNAANFAYGEDLGIEDEAWAHHFNVKFFGYLRAMREVVPHMQRNHWGRIVNIGGGAARQVTGMGTSGPNNAAIVNMTKIMSDALAKDGITANVVHPGAADSDRRPLQIEFRARQRGITLEQAEAEIDANVPPIGRKVVSADTGNLVAFLASEAAAAITGQTLAIDGGSNRQVIY